MLGEIWDKQRKCVLKIVQIKVFRLHMAVRPLVDPHSPPFPPYLSQLRAEWIRHRNVSDARVEICGCAVVECQLPLCRSE